MGGLIGGGDDDGGMSDNLAKQQAEADRKMEIQRQRLTNQRMRVIQSAGAQQWSNPDQPQPNSNDNQPTGAP
ncbi:MAG TPA: hypothetical protein VMX17_01910 [Candidatus Glassbacteria bacterium]|nr:hypothetical protein [Candidatus Glassbacteria bacterium]